MHSKPLAIVVSVTLTMWSAWCVQAVFGVEEDGVSVTGSVRQRSLATEVAEMRDLTRAEVLDFYTNEVDLEYSEWANSDADRRTWNEMRQRKMSAVRSEGRLHQGEIQYRKAYRSFEEAYPGRNALKWYSYSGMSHEWMIKRNRELFLIGYTLMWLQSFADTTGQVRYQGVWAKVMEAPSVTPQPK